MIVFIDTMSCIMYCTYMYKYCTTASVSYTTRVCVCVPAGETTEEVA